MYQAAAFFREKVLRINEPMRHLRLLIFFLIIFSCISIFFLPHVIDGDAVTYVDAIKVLNGAPLDASIGMHDYVIHRIMTTFLGLEIINGLSFVFGSIEVAWLVWAAILYFLVNIVFYKLLLKMFCSPRTALIGGLFFAANYAMVIFGLTYFMDIGGWAFYVFSIYFLYSYIETGKQRGLWIATLFIAIGGFFKENALIAYVPLFLTLLYEYRSYPVTFLKKIIPLSIVAFLPTTIHWIVVYIGYGESYLHWVRINHTVYVYNSRIIEYIKSLGSLLTFLAPVSLLGLWTFGRNFRDTTVSGSITQKIFITGVLISSIPAIMWPGITQRVLFMVVPGLVMVACFGIKRYEKYWYIFALLLLLYTTSSYFMDSYILDFVNLPF